MVGLVLTATSTQAMAQTPDQIPIRTTTQASASASMTAYVVRPGDTLSEIGRRHFERPEDWRQVQTLNRVIDPRRLPVGRTLQIPTRFFRTIRIEARLAGFRGPVTLFHAGTASPPRLDQKLVEGDVVQTGPNGFARLTLSDGGNISVPSNTRLRLDQLRSDPMSDQPNLSITVLQGRIESHVAPVRNGGGYTVRTPVSVSAVRGTVFRTAFNATDASALSEVLEGAVAVEAGGATSVLPSGSGAVMGTSGLTVAPLPPAPYLATPDKPQSGPDLVFDITPVQGATAYRAQLASDPGLSDILAETESAPGDARVTFPDMADGFHVVAISAVSAEGLEGPRSVYDFLRVRNTLDDLSGEAVTNASGKAAHLFRWTSQGTAAPTYRFILYRMDKGDDPVEPLIDQGGLKEPHIQIPDLRPGLYSWKVRVSRTVQGQLVDLWSAPQTFIVQP